MGVSSAFSRVDGAPHPRREAGLAAASGSPGTTEVVRLEQRPRALLLAGSTSAAASRLHIHRNTERYRLRRLE
ncbi:MAG: helix-turn-helix domain-containing protein [Dermatophilaceae bacterium]